MKITDLRKGFTIPSPGQKGNARVPLKYVLAIMNPRVKPRSRHKISQINRERWDDPAWREKTGKNISMGLRARYGYAKGSVGGR